MADQTQRLEIATVNAEIGSAIIKRFSNDALAAAEIPTDSGNIPNLKQVIATIQEDGAEKISFATTIYPTTAAGIAATTDGAIFLVKSAAADEVYEVWQNVSSVATDTGKRALTATAITAAMDSATESAEDAQESAEQAAARVAPILGPFAVAPTTRNDSSPLQEGDEYQNTVDHLRYSWSGSAWVALNSSAQSLEGRLADPSNGARLVALSTVGTVADAIKHAVPLAMTSAAVLAAIDYAAAHGLSVEIPDGTYTGSGILTSNPVSMVLRPNAFLNFDLEITGRYAMQSNSVTLVGDFPVYPVGTTAFPGNFSAYAPGNVVMIELSAGGSQAYNEAGFDFAVVQTADASQLVLTTGTRLAYRDPKISKLSNAAKHAVTIARDSITIAGNYTSQFVQGDILRIENVDGTGGAEGSAFYFELNKVAAIDNTQITLETRTITSYANPWLVKADMVRSAKISGGRIKRLTLRNIHEVSLLNVDVDRPLFAAWYKGQVIGGIRRGLQEPSTSNGTWLFNTSMDGLDNGNSLSSTDNAAFKLLSCPNMKLTNISGGNSKATAQGNYGVFIDFFYTPYRIWNENLQASNIRGETPNGGSDRAVWITGVRNGDIQVTGGHVFLQSMVDTVAKVLCPEKQLEISDLVRCNVSGDSRYVNWFGGADNKLDVTVRDTQGANSNRCCWARQGTKNPETGTAYTQGNNNEFNVINYSTNASDTTLYLQQQDNPLIGDKCRDKLGLANSVSLGSLVSGQRIAPNWLQNPIPTSSSWVSKRVKGYLKMDGDYNDGGISINGSYLWAQGGAFRALGSKPTSSLLGSPLGQKVAVPASATAAGKPGDFASGAGFAYFYRGDGTTHVWERVATVTW